MKTLLFTNSIFLFFYLTVCAQEAKLMLPLGHSGKINSAQFSNDGKRIVTTADQTAKLWDAETGTLLADLKGGDYACFSPDGKKIVTASKRDSLVRLWDAQSGALQQNWKIKLSGVDYVNFLPNGEKLVTVSQHNDKEPDNIKHINIWNAKTGDRLGGFSTLYTSKFPFKLWFSPDGEKAIIDYFDGEGNLKEGLFNLKINKVQAVNGLTDSVLFTQTGKIIFNFKIKNKYDAHANDYQKIFILKGNNALIMNPQTGAILASLKGYSNSFKNPVFSPKGNKIILFNDNTSILWDTQTGAILAYLKGYTSNFKNPVFSPNGKTIIMSGIDTSKIWDTQTGLLLNDFNGSKIYHASFSIDSKKIISFLDSKLLPIPEDKFYFDNDGNRLSFKTFYYNIPKIWDAQTGALLTDLSGHTMYVKSPVFSTDGKKVTFAVGNCKMVWDVQTGKPMVNLRGLKLNDDLTFSADGTRILTKSDSIAKLWDAQTGELLTKTKTAVVEAGFSPGGDRIITISDTTAYLLDARTGLNIGSLNGHKSDMPFLGQANYGFINATFSPDGKKIVTRSTSDSITFVWESQTGHLLYMITGNKKNSGNIKFSPNGKKIVTLRDSTAELRDAQTGIIINSFIGYQYPESGTAFKKPLNVIFSPDGKRIIIPNSKSLKIFDTQTNELLAELKGLAYNLTEIGFSSDGKKIFSFSEAIADTLSVTDKDGNQNGVKLVFSNMDLKPVKIWDTQTGTLISEISWDYDSHVNNAADDKLLRQVKFSPDGTKIFTTAGNGTIRSWDAQNGTEFKPSNRDHSTGNKRKVSPDGTKFITTESNDTKIWDIKTGTLLANLQGKQFEFDSLVFSPDLKRIVTNLGNGAIIYDLATGSKLAHLNRNSEPINNITFSTDGKRIISNGLTSTIWDAETGKMLYNFFLADSIDYLVTDPYGRYDGTESARKLLYFTCGTEVIGLDQVKDQLWVPNLAERITKGDSINAKKLSDLDICGLIPQVEKEERSGYHFKITPQRGGLGETVLFVNDIEVKRYKASQLLKTATAYELNITDQELQPYFIAGQENSVLVKAYTSKNDISSRGAKSIKDETKKQAIAPNLYAVMIGISDYKGPELQLKFAVKDASDISDALRTCAGKLLGKEHVFTYNLTTSANHYQLPEKIAVKNVLQEIGKKATANDILLIFFAGHGVTSGEKKQFYFLTADASQASATDAPDQVGISTAELSEWMKPANIKAQKRILILDACNSGQAINELVKVGNSDQNYLAARNDDKAEQIKAIDKLNEKSGLFILAASASNQSAYEMGRYSQGLLTYSLLKAIKQDPNILEDNKYLNVSRWFNAAEKTVSDMVRETGNRQEPQIVSAGNFNIGLVDQEVMAGIKLAEEKPLFTASNFQNSALDDDNLEISSLINQNMYEISARNSNSQLSYVTASNSRDAWSLSGRYEVQGDDIIIKINIKQNREIKTKLEIKGKNAELKALAENVVNQATNWILKIKKQ